MVDVQLYNGDCLEIMPTLPKVDAIITDIPYGTTACSWDEIIPFDDMWREVKRISNVFITTASQPFTSKLIMSNLEWFKYELMWHKTKKSGFMNCSYTPLKAHENILIFSKLRSRSNQFINEKMTYNPQNLIISNKKMVGKKTETAINNIRGTTGKEYIQKYVNYPDSVIKIKSNTKHDHPTQKPVALYEYLIRTYTNEGDTVLDITMGSGTTGVACVQTGRNFIGIEIDEQYFKIAQKRIAEAQMQPLLIERGL